MATIKNQALCTFLRPSSFLRAREQSIIPASILTSTHSKIYPSYTSPRSISSRSRFVPRVPTVSREISTISRSTAKMGIPSDITLYTSATPNGIKISILLEELGLDYKVRFVNLDNHEQKQPDFLVINPNGRIPALTDTFSDGTPIRIFESGAIMQYLVERYDAEHKVSYPAGSKEHWEVTSWLMWQMGGLGPMQGQSNHFKRYAPERVPYGITRYSNETRRLYRVLDTQLAKSQAQGSDFIVGDRVTVADIACWTWVASHTWAGIRDLEDSFPHVNTWLTTLLQRPAFEKGRHVPKHHTAFENDLLTDEQLDAKAKGLSVWVLQTMKDAAREGAAKA